MNWYNFDGQMIVGLLTDEAVKLQANTIIIKSRFKIVSALSKVSQMPQTTLDYK